MAWTSVGFDGTITEIQWAGMASLLGNGYVAAGNGDCLVTAVPGARSVSVAAGSLYGDGVLSTNSGAETVAMTTPVNGQWYVIALRRTWATNTAALVAIAGATTTTTTPTAPPTSFPVMNTNVGVLTDQPIAWAWCNSANTTVVVYDIRLKPVKSLPPVVATSAERDAKFMSPTQGLQVWRDDLGAVETYYGLYNASTNPGGRDTAGWYTTDRAGGLVPIKPNTVTIGSGTGTATALGKINFTGATSVTLDNVFTSAFSHYRVIIKAKSNTGTPEVWFQFRQNGVNQTDQYYGIVHYGIYSGSFYGANARNNGTEGWCMVTGSIGHSVSTLEIEATAGYSTMNMSGQFAVFGSEAVGGYSAYTSAKPDGFRIYPSASNLEGYVQVFGYNV